MTHNVVNVPNVLSVARMLMLPLLGWLIQRGHGVSACIVLSIAGVTDIIDGWYARAYKQETALGKLLDPIADKVLVCFAVVFLLDQPQSQLNPWIAVLLLSREFLVTGLRAMAAAEGLVIGAGQTGKLKTFTQFIGLGALMLNVDPLGLPSKIIGQISLVISVFLSYGSMVQYIRLAYLELKSKVR